MRLSASNRRKAKFFFRPQETGLWPFATLCRFYSGGTDLKIVFHSVRDTTRATAAIKRKTVSRWFALDVELYEKPQRCNKRTLCIGIPQLLRTLSYHAHESAIYCILDDVNLFLTFVINKTMA